MIKKLKSRAGLTLTELLVTMLILTMFSSACLIGITTAFRARQDNIKANDADILASMVTQLITDELRLSGKAEIVPATESVSPSCEMLSYENHTEDIQVKLYVDTNGHLCRSTALGEYPMLSDAAYSTTDLRIENLSFDIPSDPDNAIIIVTFDICDGFGGATLVKERTFTVKPLNGIS